jgi:cell wall-associated NlpC family hydrolase
MSGLDKRLFAFRPDLADIRLQGQCEAAAFVEGVPSQCAVPVTSVFRTPADDAMQVTQMLLGESLQVFERKNGWAWVQLEHDRYVGYVRENALRDSNIKPTHHVSVLSSHIYPKADIKTQPAVAVPMMAQLAVLETHDTFHKLASGDYIYHSHTNKAFASDFVAIAEQFLHAPYLWGGKTALGIDCSGLVQIALAAWGIAAPRDSDMQQQGLGHDVVQETLKRGDLMFWKGHVGILQDGQTLLHANGHHMRVVSEPLQAALDRIGAKGFPVTAIKRLYSVD